MRDTLNQLYTKKFHYQKALPFHCNLYSLVNKNRSLFTLAKNNCDSWLFFFSSYSTSKTLLSWKSDWSHKISRCVVLREREGDMPGTVRSVVRRVRDEEHEALGFWAQITDKMSREESAFKTSLWHLQLVSVQNKVRRTELNDAKAKGQNHVSTTRQP